jgi:lysozyme
MNAYAFLDPSIDRRLARDVDTAEADRLVAYRDTLGNWTIGRGHLLPPAAPGRSWEGFTIIQSTSDRWYNEDLLAASALAFKWPEFQKCDTDCRKNALREIAFNMGGKWGEFVHARAAIEQQNWPEVKAQLLDSLWARQVHGRAERIADYFLTGEYPSVPAAV